MDVATYNAAFVGQYRGTRYYTIRWQECQQAETLTLIFLRSSTKS